MALHLGRSGGLIFQMREQTHRAAPFVGTRFVDGVVDAIETLGYGYHSTPASTAEADGERRDTYR